MLSSLANVAEQSGHFILSFSVATCVFMCLLRYLFCLKLFSQISHWTPCPSLMCFIKPSFLEKLLSQILHFNTVPECFVLSCLTKFLFWLYTFPQVLHLNCGFLPSFLLLLWPLDSFPKSFLTESSSSSMWTFSLCSVKSLPLSNFRSHE